MRMHAIDLGEGVVVDAVVKLVGVDVVGALQARHRDGVRPHAVHSLEVLGVAEQARELVAVLLEAKEHAQAHVIDAPVHGAVHGLGVVVVVMLGPRGVKLEVALLVVGLLEEDVGPDSRVLEHAVLLHRSGGDVHVHAANGTVLVLDRVDRLDALEDVLDRIHPRVLARLDRQALVPHVLQGDHLAANLVLRELLARDVPVLGVVRAVRAAIDAVVGKIERGKEHDAVAVVGELDLSRQLKDLLVELGDLAGEKDARLAVREARAVAAVAQGAGPGLLEQRLDQRHVARVRRGIVEGLANLLVVDEVLGRAGPRVILRHMLLPFAVRPRDSPGLPPQRFARRAWRKARAP